MIAYALAFLDPAKVTQTMTDNYPRIITTAYA